ALVDVLVRAAPRVMDAHRVVGRDRTVEKAPARTTLELGPQPRECPTIPPQLEDLVFKLDEILFGVDRTEQCNLGAWVGHATAGIPRSSPPRTQAGSEYPTRDAPSAG